MEGRVTGVGRGGGRRWELPGASQLLLLVLLLPSSPITKDETPGLVPTEREFAPLKCLGKGKEMGKKEEGEGEGDHLPLCFKPDSSRVQRSHLPKLKPQAILAAASTLKRLRPLSHHKINEAFGLYCQGRTTKPQFPPQQCLDALALL